MLDLRERRHIRTEIESRLLELRHDAELAGEPFSAASLDAFWAFLDSHPNAIRPAIFLLDNGNLRALWKNDAREQVGLQFLGNGDVQFVIFSRQHGSFEMTREAGLRPLDEIGALIAETDGERLLTG
jgi:hypothetical protein